MREGHYLKCIHLCHSGKCPEKKLNFSDTIAIKSCLWMAKNCYSLNIKFGLFILVEFINLFSTSPPPIEIQMDTVMLFRSRIYAERIYSVTPIWGARYFKGKNRKREKNVWRWTPRIGRFSQIETQHMCSQLPPAGLYNVRFFSFVQRASHAHSSIV